MLPLTLPTSAPPQVSATRKGLKNQLKNFWFSGTKRSDGPEVGRTDDGQYPYTSTEAQIRLLGDLAFMLRDYELALSNYRLLAGDYRGDKAWKHLAGTLVRGPRFAGGCGIGWKAGG